MTEREFNWVKVRAECSAEAVFQRLRLSLEVDARSRTDMLLKENAPYGFTTISQGASVSVFIQGGITEPRSIVFTQTADGISVRDGNDKAMMEATLTLNNDGDCRLKVDGKELELWQFRKLALEDFFFSSPIAKQRA